MYNEWEQPSGGEYEKTDVSLCGLPKETTVQHKIRYPGTISETEGIL